MDNITISLPEIPNLLNMGPFFYVLVHLSMAAISGIFFWKNVGFAGKCYGASNQKNDKLDYRGDAYAWKAVVSGVIMFANAIAAFAMSCMLFDRSMQLVDDRPIWTRLVDLM